MFNIIKKSTLFTPTFVFTALLISTSVSAVPTSNLEKEYSLYKEVSSNTEKLRFAVENTIITKENSTAQKSSSDSIYIKDKELYIGQSIKDLDTPDRIDKSYNGIDYYIYNDDYSNYYQVGVQKDKVVYIYSISKNISFKDISYGKSANPTYNYDNYDVKCYFDKFKDNTVYAISIYAKDIDTSIVENEETRTSTEKQIFDITNAYRAQYDKPAFIWSEEASVASRLHSQDMEDRNYFNHDTPERVTFVDRLKKQGITDWSSVAENIISGYKDSFGAVNGWINSEGHRNNLLSDMKYLGVGSSLTSKLCTQDFFSSFE